ncbi:hypothetical protein M0R45_001634 [Rubus argutus]|uniref:Uncharacterized protein n=1 Tax=Rubus argutus TaxID=59490 RepID=A0AAW1VHK2_RUBAR
MEEKKNLQKGKPREKPRKREEKRPSLCRHRSPTFAGDSISHLVVDSTVAALPLLRRREIPSSRRFKSADMPSHQSPIAGVAHSQSSRRFITSTPWSSLQATARKIREQMKKKRLEATDRNPQIDADVAPASPSFTVAALPSGTASTIDLQPHHCAFAVLLTLNPASIQSNGPRPRRAITFHLRRRRRASLLEKG